MKLAVIFSFLMLPLLLFKAHAGELVFHEPIVLKKVYLSKKVLPSDLLNLYRVFNYDQVRIIAGKKSTWSDDLRNKLKGTGGNFRF